MNIPLFRFAYHPAHVWLQQVAKDVKYEPWGREDKVLELYLRANFEIAKAQSKVYEDRDKNMAFWRAGSLVNDTADPVWLTYRRNNRDDPYWSFNKVVSGDAPLGLDSAQFALKYEPPEFHPEWPVHFEQHTIHHILTDSRNRARLQEVFGNHDGEFNEHLAFRAIYGEIQLKRKEEVVIPQWYHGDYKFLMPLFLTQPDHVELTAALQPDPALRRYMVRTLLLPAYAYAHARAVVKSRANFADWIMLSQQELDKAGSEDEDEGEP